MARTTMTGFRIPLLIGAEEGGFTWWGVLGHLTGHPQWANAPFYLVMGWVVAGVLTVFSIAVRLSLSKGDPVLPPEPGRMGLSDWIRTLFEGAVGFLVATVDD